MNQQSPLLVVLADEQDRAIANQIAHFIGYSFAHIVIGKPSDAAPYIQQTGISPYYIVVDIAEQTIEEALQEIDHLSNHCVPGTNVVVLGQANDIRFYRALIDRGVLEYFPKPASVDDIAKALLRHKETLTKSTSVISFMSAAAGDGSSTVALNTAYSLAKDYNAKSIIVDMDYQFGMVAKNLDLSSPFGIKELFEHPDRGVDSTLIERMVVGYNNNLDVIAAPNDLKFMPDLAPEIIRDLVNTLREKYKFVILDLPHTWSPWISAAFTNSNHVMLVAQLWLKSVTHATRLLNVWREMGISDERVLTVVNRSGAKYKEGVSAKDFERVCNKPIAHFLSNDIKTVVTAENQGKTIVELGKSKLAQELQKIAEGFHLQLGGTSAPSATAGTEKPALLSFRR